MRFTPDVRRGGWIAERLNGWATVAGTVGTGWEAYARILHPPHTREGMPLTWATVAAENGVSVGPAARWWEVAAHARYDDPDARYEEPREGRLELASLAELARVLRDHGDDAATAAFWNGDSLQRPEGASGVLYALAGTSALAMWRARRRVRRERQDAVDSRIERAVRSGEPLLHLAARDYVLLEARVSEFTDTGWPDRAGVGWRWGDGPTPNLLWPADRSWLVATEADYDSTLVGGSRALVDGILASSLEAFEVTEELSLAIDA